MAQQQSAEVVARLFTDLRSKNDIVRKDAVQSRRLLAYLNAAIRELPSDRFQELYTSINGRISGLIIHSNDNNDRIAGIYALDQLIDFDGDDAAQKTTRFAGYLRTVMQGNNFAAMQLAARCIGKLAIPGGTLTAELVDSEVKLALEWLTSDRQEGRRFAAVLTLRELAQKSPTLLYSFVPQILEVIWVALRDQKVMIRESAAQAVRECFSIIAARDPQLRQQWFARIYDEIIRSFTMNTVEAVHGALLTIKELLEKGGMFMTEHYREACEIILRYKDYRDNMVKRLVVELIPVLARYSPLDFVNLYLHKFMTYLQTHLKREKDRNAAFLAVGTVAASVGSAITPYLDTILSYIREGLTSKAKNKQINEAPVFECLSRLAEAVGQSLSKYMEILLDPIFKCGLSLPLTSALTEIAKFIPPIKPLIQDKLLDMLSHVLCGRPFIPLGAPQSGLPPPPINFQQLRDPTAQEQRDQEIHLALETLSDFDFEGHVLNEFVRDVCIKYVDDGNPQIRQAAALTSCNLLIRDPIVHQISNYAIKVVSEIVSKLVTACVADPEPTIREQVLVKLGRKFDRHLARAENIRSLFLCLNDEVFEIREAAISIIGRLTLVNPAYVMPSLRKTLIQLLTEIDHATGARSREESAKLLSHLVSSSQTLIRPYVEPMMKVLLPRARDSNASVAATVLRAIGEVAAAGGEDMIQYIQELMPVIIEALQDLSSQLRRDAALWTLGRLATDSGYVIEPFIEYPKLLTILVNIVKTEPVSDIRKETVRLMGVLGALDPYRHQQLLEKSPESQLVAEANAITDVSLIMNGLLPSAEEYYPTVVINTLMNILKDPSLVSLHTAVIDAVMNIFKTLGLKCVPFLGQIIPGFLQVIRNFPSSQRLESFFNQLSILVTIVRQHIRTYLKEILDLITDYWGKSQTLQSTILQLIEAISRSLEGEFKVYLSRLLPMMLEVVDKDASPYRTPSTKVLNALVVFGSSSEEYMHLIIPVIVRVFEKAQNPPTIRKVAIETIGKLSKQVNISDYASKILHPLARVLASAELSLRQAAMDTVCALIFQLGRDYMHFIPTIGKVLETQRISNKNYELLVSKLRRGENLPQDLSPDSHYPDQNDEAPYSEIQLKKLQVNQIHLKNAWEASQKSTREDWQEWIRRFSVELLKESPSQALRACANLASNYYPLAKDLFNAAFISCWGELQDKYQEDLVRSIETALTSPNIPPEILQILLNLAEFMEHDDKALPIDIRTLGQYAGKCHAYAKALHYKELEFLQDTTTSSVEALISINNALQQEDAAIGILRKAQAYTDVALKENWFERLGRWDEALEAYQKRELEMKPASEREAFDITMGKMRCLHALGEWELLSQAAQQLWTGATLEVRRSLAPLAAAAAWGLGQWEHMDDYLNAMKTHSPDRSFHGAILAIHRNQFGDATSNIARARSGLDTELGALLGESYNRAYGQVVRVQMLAELEEIVVYKQNANFPEKQETMRRTWTKRLKGCQRNVEVWQRMLKVRALVITPRENMEMWIKFANLCRKSNRVSLAEKALNLLKGSNQNGADLHPLVKYADLKFRWTRGDRGQALEELKDFTKGLADQLEASRAVPLNMNGVNGDSVPNGIRAVNGDYSGSVQPSEDYASLLARCYLKQGEWQIAQQKGDWKHEHVSDILDAYSSATQYNANWYKAWHAWALANFEVVNSITEREETTMSRASIQQHVVPAILGFFKSISLSSGSSLQDTLRLLTLWFEYGGNHEVNTAVTEGFATVSVDTWLEVMPQLIARINQRNERVRHSIHNLLADVGRAHPQALVYPLTVAMKSNVTQRSRSAAQIMDSMRQHSTKLVEQADLVSMELIRVAVLWHELWHEGLEEASRLYFGDHNVDGMFATLAPLHEMLERGASTLRETSFLQAFGRDLNEAKDWCRAYRQSNEVSDINQAWDLYYQVFRRIARQLPQLINLELQYVSPELRKTHDLDLAVPGTYQSGKPVIRIIKFDESFSVIISKQRPRKVSLRGSDGKDYTFCLKGHEDIRQDERVMQLFGLVNTLLDTDTECFKRHLNIQRYPAIPLSQNSGLLGWVPNSDTLHMLIREYRESRKILLNIEHRIMLQMAPDYDNLTLMQKVEVFDYALENTTGQDLYRVLWLKSKSSESWLDRRTNYTRSLAVMSMVGYILGLGDRHPSNLMLDRLSGKIIHIDFGDCFEKAMHRDKFPERVPFRLTRMLTSAMEVSNIEGSFRITCEAVMRVLRDNQESLMAVLEAFIHDPLLNWRLMNRESPMEPSFPSERRQSVVGDQADPSSYRPRARSGLTNGYITSNSVSEAHPQPQPPPNDDADPRDVQNERAVAVLNRVKEKLTGRDFGKNEELDVEGQVEKLIQQAVSLENLCQHYIGWCSFW
ncbi:MAG: phosphatidylinositol kinase- protein kinase tor1 [Vezdaea aestivalis]|nr:MAG: phosphatidylinositol kinase- protein kinase tor1 [Vezdaea aestivalis]